MVPNILVVESCPQVRRVLVRMLDRDATLNCIVYDVHSTEERTDILETKRIDLVLLEARIPVISALDTIKRIQRQRVMTEPSVILTLNGALPEQIRELARRGVRAFMRKPFRKKTLCFVVGRVLEESWKFSKWGDLASRLN